MGQAHITFIANLDNNNNIENITQSKQTLLLIKLILMTLKIPQTIGFWAKHIFYLQIKTKFIVVILLALYSQSQRTQFMEARICCIYFIEKNNSST